MKNNNSKICVSIKLIILNAGKVLIVETDDGIIDIPGGKVEFGESNLGALKRELKEELDLDLNLKPAKLWHSWNYVTKKCDRHSVYVVYMVKVNKTPKVQAQEGQKIMWLDLKQVQKLKHISEFKMMLIRALAESN